MRPTTQGPWRSSARRSSRQGCPDVPGSSDPPSHRRVLDAPDEARPHPLDRPRELAALEALAELSEGVPQLEAREVGAQADVLAHAKADVRVRLAIDAEGERIEEDVLVAIRRGVEEARRLPLADGLPTQLVVAGGRAGELDDRSRPADHFLDGGVEKRGVCAELLPLG